VLAQQRHDFVLERLRAEGAIRVTDLVTRLGISDGTARRDLEILEERGLLTRVRGGAVLAGGSSVPVHADHAGSDPLSSPAADPFVVGMLVPSATYYYPEVIRGAQSAATTAGSRLVLGVADYTGDRDADQLRDLIRSGCDGLLVTTGTGPVVPTPVLDLLEESGLPYVLVERRSSMMFDHAEYVVSDHRQGAYRAVEHLAALGHRAVALFAHFTPTARPVTEGHTEAVTRLGLDASAPVIAPGPDADRLASIDAFARACRESGVTAALVHSDQEAILLVQRLRTDGVRIPEDLAVIAYDDEVAAFAEVPLTAVAPPKFEVGRTAAATLLARLGGAAGEPPVRQTVLQPRLTVRASTGARVGAGASGGAGAGAEARSQTADVPAAAR
jgi:DNA-binding LacI/PurR family transcriptional regulator